MKKPTILIVDDDESIRKLAILALGKNKYDFVEAADGDSTIKQLEHSLPDLVIQDLNLPDIDGLELNRIILAYDPEMPIIAFTGFTLKLGENYRGFVGFVLKPIVPDNLITVVEQYIDGNKNIKYNQHL